MEPTPDRGKWLEPELVSLTRAQVCSRVANDVNLAQLLRPYYFFSQVALALVSVLVPQLLPPLEISPLVKEEASPLANKEITICIN